MAASGPVIPEGLAWQMIFHQAPMPTAILDLQGRFLYVNPALCHLTGYDHDSLFGLSVREFVHPEDTSAEIDALFTGETSRAEAEKRSLRADGSVFWVSVITALIKDDDGRARFIMAQFQETTVRRETELLWARTFANAPIGMALLDLSGCWKDVNERLCDMVGYSRDELLTMHFTDLTYPDEDADGNRLLADLLEGRKEVVNLEKRYRHKDGHPVWMLIRSSVITGVDGRPSYLVSQYETIGDGRMRDSHLAHMALHDPLTGLANRALLTDRFDQELADLSGRAEVLAVLLADLDGLKRTNDRYGHVVGDQLLTTAADELLNAVRAGDTVARLGGDEFVVLTRVADSPAAEALRDRVARRLNTDIAVSGHHIGMSASVGLATTHNPTQLETLLQSADRDMYTHKPDGRG